ncbi:MULTISPECIES: hypothetical protein [Lysinibacillus]|uniref:hypothetical protein n=1 Tax=Lysinibacillus TaxID=400634 RepID=UPI0021A5BA2A|nr:hypothetical protein [Lysinibacillus capsici]MCT1539487.1 hypothetical protein [Lysinibacillus capsici]MCT1570446.1 hypothetical protein [Lysinibacillus capsici]MCT1647646.1 hypothetical protein [Lysinibacillus capsici]MCT1726075.1 hypothetical protein [Lysinibacillus capsici]MCT1783180.1 hypothetical protein [Lysinibacillus capsici]
MNLARISEEFGEQIAAITAGTRYEISSESDNDVPVMEARIRNTMYCLWKDATSKELAKYLNQSAEQYFQELYEFSYGVTSYDEDVTVSKGTERLALMIIAEKENRKRQIDRLERGYERFRSILDSLPTQDVEVLQQYFIERKKVDYELLRGVVKKHLKSIEAYYDSDTEAADQRSKEISNDIEGLAPKIKPITEQQLEKNKKRTMKQLNKLFK